jgi:hypothetical protein
MGQSEIPYALRLKLQQNARINAHREASAKHILYCHCIALHEQEGVGYKRLVDFSRRYMELEKEFYSDPEVELEHARQRLATMGIDIPEVFWKAPEEGFTKKQQEVRDNAMEATQVAILVAAVAMNDVFTIGHDRQIRIAQAVNVLCKQNLSWLLEKMKALGFRVMPDGRVVYAMDETGKAVRF